METCEVLIVGGGPAGSTCAWKLQQAGLDVLLLDKERFPRAKPCAGWITPQVLGLLGIEQEDYCRERVLQAISAFRTGLIGGPELLTSYGTVVSYGIRRCEFDHYLLQRSGVRLLLGETAATLSRQNGWWLINGHIRARLLVGAGGHFCPVAALLGAKIGKEEVIVAQVAEFALRPDQENLCSIPADTPGIYFCRDMKGYGWLFRKGRYLNLGLGRLDPNHLSRHTGDFCTFLSQRGYLGGGLSSSFQGHAYRLSSQQSGHDCVSDSVLLIGDAAGLARPQSGEGILPAIESALLAAETVLAARGDYRAAKLAPYVAGLANRFGKGSGPPLSPLAAMFLRGIGARLLSSRWFTRHVVLDRWFLHNSQSVLPLFGS